ncbi:hypothetical protein G3T14_10665 [Methylobacterium sp. BTF04]|uniref:hypothetical protein n=1 Tax=Methylobacterium sp. BTF04 TaxID=2708300 RepID=UPI0013D856E7|nr:hypothetical protein [Methylobacterium sp. BTF04]NEU12599.1 hypothetical protein [Methylobacterium sp. BTF04]
MPWRRKAITPNFLPFGENNRTYDPGLVVEVEPVLDISASPIWRDALLTDGGRRDLPPVVREAWHVRRLGTVDPFAIVVRLNPHLLGGRILSRGREQGAIAQTDRSIVIMPELLLMVRGVEVRRAWSLLADEMVGTRQRPRQRVRPSTAPAEHLEALLLLTPDADAARLKGDPT